MAQTEPATVNAVSEDFDISRQEDVAKLRKGAVGLGGVLFLTLTGSAPITAMLLNVPILVGSGQGLGSPAAFIVAAVVLVIFSVGYVAMSRKKTGTGGFYSYLVQPLAFTRVSYRRTAATTIRCRQREGALRVQEAGLHLGFHDLADAGAREVRPDLHLLRGFDAADA